MTNKIMFYLSLFKEEDKNGLRIRTNLRKDPMTNIILRGKSLLSLTGTELKDFKDTLVGAINSTILYDLKKSGGVFRYSKVEFEKEESTEGFLRVMNGNKYTSFTTSITPLDPDERKMILEILYEGLSKQGTLPSI